MFTKTIHTKNQEIHLPVLSQKRVRLFIKREDVIHKFVSGNKFRKLKYNIQEAQQQQQRTLLTFGGAYSNHIVATAVAGNLCGFKTIGIIRGEELKANFSKILQDNKTLYHSHQNGMQFEFVSREDFRQKNDDAFIAQLRKTFGDFYLIPEGGTNSLAIKGCEEILQKEDEKFDYICCAVGTGGTLSGLINSATNNQKVIGFPALKGNFLSTDIKTMVKRSNWYLNTNYHFGGYGKINADLIQFINQFKQETSVLLDPIYTAKMLYGILDLVKQDYFKSGSKILAIHTGGIQGIDGINNRLRNKNLNTIKV